MRDEQPGQPLSHYRQHGVGVRIYCRCGAYKTLDLETAISNLGEKFDVMQVWTKAKAECERCGRVDWRESRPAFSAGGRTGPRGSV